MHESSRNVGVIPLIYKVISINRVKQPDATLATLAAHSHAIPASVTINCSVSCTWHMLQRDCNACWLPSFVHLSSLNTHKGHRSCLT